MALADRVLVYGDCAVIPDPTAEQLADIAISSAATAAQFGIEPRVAMLSYSTGESGSGADVEKVRDATALVRERAPELLVEGPIQYDAAADAAVARGEDARLRRRRARDGVHLPRPQHRQQHLQGGAALGGRRRDRAGAAGSQQADQRPLARRARATTSSTPSRSPRSRRRARRPHERRARRQPRFVVVQVPADRHGDRAHARVGARRAHRRGRRARRRTPCSAVAPDGAGADRARRDAHARAADPRPHRRLRGHARRVRRARPVARRAPAGRRRPPRRARRRPVLRADRSITAARRDQHRRARRCSRRCTTPANLAGHRRRAARRSPTCRTSPSSTRRSTRRCRPAAYTYAIDARARRQPTASAATGSTARRTSSSREAAAAFLGRPLGELKQIVFHLGNGASVTAIDGGRSVDTSMGMTPLEGLVMGTRSGDIDPAVLFHLAAARGHDRSTTSTTCSTSAAGCSGLAGAADMRDIARGRRARATPRRRSPFEVYVHRLRAYVGAYLAQLGGVDVISFTAGVGENCAAACAPGALETLGFAGVEIDPERNARAARGIRMHLDGCLGRHRARRPDERGARDRAADPERRRLTRGVSTGARPHTLLTHSLTARSLNGTWRPRHRRWRFCGPRRPARSDRLRRRAVRSRRRAHADRRGAHARVADDVRGALRGVGHQPAVHRARLLRPPRRQEALRRRRRACCARATSRCRGAIRRTRRRPTPCAASATARTSSSSACCATRASRRTRARSRCSTCSPRPARPSRSCRARRTPKRCCAAAGIRDRFPVVMDGVIAERDHLASKPAPDVFVEAARMLRRRSRPQRRRRGRPQRRAARPSPAASASSSASTAASALQALHRRRRPHRGRRRSSCRARSSRITA